MLAFSVYGVLILPLRLHFRLTLAKKSSYFVRVEAVGLPVPGLRRAGRKKTPQEEASPKKAHALSEINVRWLQCLMEKPIFSKVCRLGKLSFLHLDLYIAFGNAAATALLYSFSRTLLTVLGKTGALPEASTTEIRADFQSAEPSLSLEGIITVRLGKLMGTFLSLVRAYLRRAGRMAARAEKELPAG